MKNLPIKRWMLGASAMMIMTNVAGCSIQKDKCQEDHLYMSTVEEIKQKNNKRSYLERGTMIPMASGEICVEKVDLKNAIREKFYSKHPLIMKEWQEENPNYIHFNEYHVFGEFEKGIEQNGKIVYDDTLSEIEEDKTTIDFINYIVSLEEEKQGRYLSDTEIAEMFTVGSSYYSIKGEKEDETYTFELLIHNKESYSNRYTNGQGSYECVKQTIESTDFEIEKVESIMISPVATATNIITYSVDQSYELTFFGQNKDKDVRLFLDNEWEILNRDIIPEERYQCRNYSGSLMIEYQDEKLKTEVTEEEYEKLAEVIALTAQDKNTQEKFLQINKELLSEYFEKADTNLIMDNNSLVLKKK